MKAKSRGPLFYVFVFILMVVLIRFAPLVIRAWLPILIILIVALVFRYFQKRMRAVKEVETSDEGRKLRDVTNSVDGD